MRHLRVVLVSCLFLSVIALTQLTAVHDAGAIGNALVASGLNNNGQLGIGTDSGPSSCLYSYSCSTAPLDVELPAGVSPTGVVAAGGSNAYAVGSDGNLYAWGANNVGQLGDGTNSGPDSCAELSVVCSPTPVVVDLPPAALPPSSVVTNGSDTLALGNNGVAYAWGSNAFGGLGDAYGTDPATHIAGPDLCGSEGCSTTPEPVAVGGEVTGIATGYYANYVISNGSVYAFGYNEDGELGNSAPLGAGEPSATYLYDVPALVPLGDEAVAAVYAGGDGSTYAVEESGDIVSWGYDDSGELGQGTSGAPSSVPRLVDFPLGVTVSDLAIADESVYAVGSDGNVYVWGNNGQGELGTGDSISSDTPEVLSTWPAGATPATVAADQSSGSALAAVYVTDAAGDLYEWGVNAYGELGDGAAPASLPETVATPELSTGYQQVSAVAAGASMSVVVESGSSSAPGAPTIGTAVAGDGCATVTWTVPDNGGEPITGFTVTSSNLTTSSFATTQVEAGAIGSSLDPTAGAPDSTVVCSLVNSDSYEFEVSATNAAGLTGENSAWSNIVSPVVPLTPTVVITGSPLPAAPGPVTYSVTVSGSGSTPTGSVTVSDEVSGSSCSIDPLVAGAGSCSLVESSDNIYTILASYSGDTVYAPGTAWLQLGAATASGSGSAGAGGGVATAYGIGGTAGVDTLTDAGYEADPASGLAAGSNFFDVSLSPDNTFSQVIIKDCTDVVASTTLSWYDPTGGLGGTGGWEPVEGDPGPTYSATPAPSCLTVTLDDTTSPSLSQLTGTIFGVAQPGTSGGLAVATVSVPNAERLVPYSTNLLATGDNPPDEWSVFSGTLPRGLKLSSSGVISGTPKTDGITLLVVRVANAKTLTQPAASAYAQLELTVVQPTPAITGVDPSSGPGAGDTRVVISGTALESASSVMFGTVPAAAYSANAKGTSVVATSPTGAAGVVDVTVTTSGGTTPTSPADEFTYLAPLVTSISQASGPGVGGTEVVIDGRDLNGASAVLFGATPAQSYVVNRAGTVIKARSPSETAGTVDITVITPGGTSATSPSDEFTFEAPSITKIAPASGLTGGGTVVKITGSNLAGTSSVTFGSVPASTYTVNAAGTSIKADAPTGAVGAVDLTVTTPGGTATSTFTYADAPAGSKGFVESVYSALLHQSPSSAEITYYVHQLNAGSSDEAVISEVTESVTYDDTLVTRWFEQYLGRAPSLFEESYSVTELQDGETDEDVVATIVSSSEYIADDTGVSASCDYVAGTPCDLVEAWYADLLQQVPDETALSYLVGELNAGSTDDAVATQLLTSVTYDDTLVTRWFEQYLGRSPDESEETTYVSELQGGETDEDVVAAIVSSPEYIADAVGSAEAPSITKIAPASGLTGGGTVVKITGSNLAGTSSVTFGSVPASTYTVNAAGTSIKADAPTGAVGAVDLTVTTPGGTATSTFTYADAPAGSKGFVESVYSALLHQSPSSAEITYYVHQLNAGSSDEAVISEVTESVTYDDTLVTRWFEQYLGRAPSLFEESYSVTELQDGETDEDVVATIVSSSEYIADDTGVSASCDYVAGTPCDLVEAWYADLLQQVPDETALSYLVGELNAGSTDDAVATQLLTSVTYDDTLVTRWFEQYLGRSPDESEETTYVSELQGGETDEDVVAAIVSSPEYIADAVG